MQQLTWPILLKHPSCSHRLKIPLRKLHITLCMRHNASSVSRCVVHCAFGLDVKHARFFCDYNLSLRLWLWPSHQSRLSFAKNVSSTLSPRVFSILCSTCSYVRCRIVTFRSSFASATTLGLEVFGTAMYRTPSKTLHLLLCLGSVKVASCSLN